jgi:hypothetical protein
MEGVSLVRKENHMKSLLQIYKTHCWNRSYIISVITAALMLLASLVVNFFAGTYATSKISNPVTDIVLSNIPVFDVDWIFLSGGFALSIFIFICCVLDPKKAPFIGKTIALFVLIRSLFISLTHIGPFPSQITFDPEGFHNFFTFGGDLFFSGHTGLPFLMALIYWRHRNVRAIYLGWSILFAIVVLLGHLHYTIDVLAAFFITYTIHHIAQVVFKSDFKHVPLTTNVE